MRGRIVMDRVNQTAKAIFGGIIASITAAFTAAGIALELGEGNLDAGGWVSIGIAFFSTLTTTTATVYFVPNAESPPKQNPIYIGFEEDDDDLYETQDRGGYGASG